MDQTLVRKLLEDGLQAVTRGDKTRGRQLLLKVVEEDERNEQAWMWLSVAVEDPADKLTALENVLAINPNNASARSNARWWQQKIEAERQAPPAAELEPAQPQPLAGEVVAREITGGDGKDAEAALPTFEALEDYAPSAPLEMDDGIDDPYQCPCCGKPTAHTDRRCRQCGRSLFMQRRQVPTGRTSLRSATLATGLLGALGLVELVPMVFARDNPAAFRAFTQLETIVIFAGSFSDTFYTLLPQLFAAGVIKVVLLGFVTGALHLRVRLAYYAGLLLAAVDIIWNMAQLSLGLIGPLFWALDLAVAFWAVVQLFASDRDFGVRTERVLTQPDRGVRGPLDYHKRGHAYRERGMWAVAVVHWRYAVAGDPLKTAYYKDLGIGYAKIGRYGRSLRALAEAARQTPSDPQIRELVSLVKAKQAEDEPGLTRGKVG